LNPKICGEEYSKTCEYGDLIFGLINGRTKIVSLLKYEYED